MSEESSLEIPEQDFPEAEDATEDKLDRVVKLAEALEAQKDKVQELKDRLDDEKKELTRLQNEDLPTLMQELRLTELTLDSGRKVKVKEEVSTAITEERRPAAMRWLRDNGYGGLIKSKVIASYGKEEVEQARELVQELANSGRTAEFKEDVHPSTLKSFVKERLQQGEDVPFDLFSIHPYYVADVK